MNKDQFVYDANVQKTNRDITITQIENKIDMLKQIKAIIYAEGQQDKYYNKRRTTLQEYRKRLKDCDNKIAEQTDFVNKMKSMNGYIPRKTSITNPPKLGVKPEIIRRRSKSAHFKKNRFPTPRYPIDLEQLRKVARVILESKIEDSNDEYNWVKDSPFLKKLEVLKDLNDESAELPVESELNDEIKQAEKELKRARCCFNI